MHIEIKLSRQRNRMINFPMTVSHSCFTDAWSGDSEHQQQQQREAETTASDDAGASLFFSGRFLSRILSTFPSSAMPLLNNRRIPLTAPPPYDPRRKRKEVWYLRFTNEIFTTYEYPFFYVVQCPLWLCNACVDISVCMHRSWLQTRCSECCTWHSSTSCTSTVSNDPGHAAMLHIFYTNASISVLNYHCCC